MSNTERALSAKGRARRDQILEVAGRLFGSKGYATVSLRDIAAEAGITHPLLMHYFDTKEELLHAVMDTWRERADAHRVNATDLENLPDRVVELAEDNERTPGYVALFSGLAADGADPEHPAHTRFQDHYSHTHEVLLGYFRWAQQHGRLRPGVEPETAARTLIAIEDGAQIQWLYQPDSVQVPQVMREYLRLVTSPPPSP